MSVKYGAPRFDNHHRWLMHQPFDERIATIISVNDLTSCKPQRFSVKGPPRSWTPEVLRSIFSFQANRNNCEYIVGKYPA
jgi:hypothetical protein